MKLRIRHGVVTVWTTLSVVVAQLRGRLSVGLAAVVALTLVTNLAGCGHGPAAKTGGSPSAHRNGTSIMVFAALPLKPAFTLLAGKFQAENPGATVEFNFATSAELANKLSQGASADVFAAADTAQMDTVIKADLASGEPVNFASNTLVIVTAPGDPKQVRSFADLARPDLRVAVCQASAPCGVAAQRIEDTVNVHVDPVTEEPIGAEVLAKVTGGEADAGLVFLNDAHKAAAMVDTIHFPEAADAVNVYPIVVLKTASQPVLAEKFVELVTGATGQRVLSQAGFDGP